jgi:hypothetical protein
MVLFSFKETVTATPDKDLGSVKGFVISSDGSPVDLSNLLFYGLFYQL